MQTGFRGLNKIVWLMIFGNGLTRTVFFMTFPFLAFHLKNAFETDITTIGWVLGVGPLMGAAAGFYGGYLSDVFGRRTILIVSLIIWGITQIAFSFATTIFAFGVLCALNGILRAIAEPVIQAVISDQAGAEHKERAYHYRYFIINIGAAVGPFAGSMLLLDHLKLGFSLSGVTLLLFALVFAIQTANHFNFGRPKEKPARFLEVMKILARDKVLRCFVVASILSSFAYSQVDTSLPIILDDIFGAQGARYFGWIMAANGVTIVLFQLSLNKITKGLNTIKVVGVSSLVFGLGLAGFGFSGDVWQAYLASMIVLSLGEILVYSNGFVLIDRLAPAHLRGTYASAANLFAVGMAFGPPGGAWILKHSNQEILFVFVAGLLVICCGLYFFGDRLEKVR